MALLYHPDMQAGTQHTAQQQAENQARFVRILAAVALLTDPVQRAAYDRLDARLPNRAGPPPGDFGPPSRRVAGPGGEEPAPAWEAEYDRLVAWFYRREPLL